MVLHASEISAFMIHPCCFTATWLEGSDWRCAPLPLISRTECHTSWSGKVNSYYYRHTTTRSARIKGTTAMELILLPQENVTPLAMAPKAGRRRCKYCTSSPRWNRWNREFGSTWAETMIGIFNVYLLSSFRLLHEAKHPSKGLCWNCASWLKILCSHPVKATCDGVSKRTARIYLPVLSRSRSTSIAMLSQPYVYFRVCRHN